MTIALIDADWIVYSCAFAGETRNVRVLHKSSGKEKMFDNVTSFWGRKKNEIGGWLGEQNEKRITKGMNPFSKEDFDVEVVRSAEPVENVLHSAKMTIQRVLNETGCTEYMGWIGKGESFRKNISTIKEYKAGRPEGPLLKQEVTEYLIKHHGFKYESKYEVDDRIVIEHYKDRKNSVVVAVDKDALGTGSRVYNPNKKEMGIVDSNCFGELYLNEKKEVKGYGRIWLMHQWLWGDPVDTYSASCASDMKWGAMSAYNALKDCQNDKEAFESALNVYKALYPEPKEITGWRGDTLLIDYKYVADEIWQLAKMKRWEGDDVLATDVWKKFGMLEK